MDVLDLVRPNIRRLEPYRCARDDYKVGVLLDANENTHGTTIVGLSDAEKSWELNRYPDPHQIDLKEQICALRNAEATENGFEPGLTPANIYLGVGSDEAIDSLIRAFCAPGKDKLLICPPTYGMYTVSADVNDVEIVKVNLNLETFELRVPEVLAALNADTTIKLIYVCSPGNPTGKRIALKDIEKLLLGWKGGVVVADEAYIDFTRPSLAPLVNKHSRLIVLQTLSKSFGLAGLRLGMTFATPELARVLNAMKAPYNISTTTSEIASRALSKDSVALMRETVDKIKTQRTRLAEELPKIPGVGKIIGGLDANFLLAQILDTPGGKPNNAKALKVYSTLAEAQNVVVRFRGNEPGCEGCLRISVGTEQENTQLLQQLAEVIKQ